MINKHYIVLINPFLNFLMKRKYDDDNYQFKNLCLVCKVDMGPMNPRQLCGKIKCLGQCFKCGDFDCDGDCSSDCNTDVKDSNSKDNDYSQNHVDNSNNSIDHICNKSPDDNKNIF